MSRIYHWGPMWFCLSGKRLGSSEAQLEVSRIFSQPWSCWQQGLWRFLRCTCGRILCYQSQRRQTYLRFDYAPLGILGPRTSTRHDSRCSWSASQVRLCQGYGLIVRQLPRRSFHCTISSPLYLSQTCCSCQCCCAKYWWISKIWLAERSYISQKSSVAAYFELPLFAPFIGSFSLHWIKGWALDNPLLVRVSEQPQSEVSFSSYSWLLKEW